MSELYRTKVLMIDDEKLLLDLYKSKFESAGYEVYGCYSADDGLNILRKGYEPDAILLDITMPEKNGYEFMEACKRERLAQKSMLIALTNEGQDAEIAHMEERGADALLIKANYTPREVVTAVSNLLAERAQ